MLYFSFYSPHPIKNISFYNYLNFNRFALYLRILKNTLFHILKQTVSKLETYFETIWFVF